MDISRYKHQFSSDLIYFNALITFKMFLTATDLPNLSECLQERKEFVDRIKYRYIHCLQIDIDVFKKERNLWIELNLDTFTVFLLFLAAMTQVKLPCA